MQSCPTRILFHRLIYSKTSAATWFSNNNYKCSPQIDTISRLCRKFAAFHNCFAVGWTLTGLFFLFEDSPRSQCFLTYSIFRREQLSGESGVQCVWQLLMLSIRSSLIEWSSWIFSSISLILSDAFVATFPQEAWLDEIRSRNSDVSFKVNPKLLMTLIVSSRLRVSAEYSL